MIYAHAYEDSRGARKVEVALALIACSEDCTVRSEWWNPRQVCLALEEQFVDGEFRIGTAATGIVAQEDAVLNSAGPEFCWQVGL